MCVRPPSAVPGWVPSGMEALCDAARVCLASEPACAGVCVWLCVSEVGCVDVVCVCLAAFHVRGMRAVGF